MGERNHVEESLHFLMINVLVASLETEGFTVLADHVGGLRTRPEPIGDFVPDIDARKGDDWRLIEVETRTSLESRPVYEQMAKLASVPGAKAFLAIPFDCIEAAREIRESMEAEFGIIPCYPFVRYVGAPK